MFIALEPKSNLLAPEERHVIASQTKPPAPSAKYTIFDSGYKHVTPTGVKPLSTP